MRRTLQRLVPIAACGAVMVATQGRAQEMDRRASRFDLGVYAGGTLSSDWFESRTVIPNQTPTPFENNDEVGYSPGYAPAFGAIAHLWVTPAIGVRVHGAYVPMRFPNAEGAFETGDRAAYEMNTWLYDVNLALRPFATANVSRWLSSVYFFAGGGGLTVDLAGEDQALCQPYLAGLGACLSYATEQATVGQGTAGAGIDLIPLGPLSLFGEAAVHVYDSPTHVDDFWLGTVRAPTNTAVRVADDATVVTGRLVLGLKAMFGNLIPAPMEPPLPPPPPVVAPPPVIAPPPPPPNPMREIRVCVVENGMLREVTAMYNTQNGDTTVNGQPIPATAGYAAGAAWFINNEAITVDGRRYVRYGLPRVLGVNEVTRSADYMGVPVFSEAGAQGTPEVLYVPVRPGCEFQPYQLEVKAGGVRGE
jgi:hypothetical protein